VQGVYFRASTARRARALSVRGSAENLPDGSVLVLAAGDVAALEALTRWLQQGPPMARVDALEWDVIDPAAVAWPAGFVPK
jgi:acylphosphatase